MYVSRPSHVVWQHNLMKPASCPSSHRDTVEPHSVSAEGFLPCDTALIGLFKLRSPPCGNQTQVNNFKETSGWTSGSLHFQNNFVLSTFFHSFTLYLNFSITWQHWSWLSWSKPREPNAFSFPSLVFPLSLIPTLRLNFSPQPANWLGPLHSQSTSQICDCLVSCCEESVGLSSS